MKNQDRTGQLHLRVSARDVSVLRDLSKASGLDSSNLVRSLLYKAHAETFGHTAKASIDPEAHTG